MLILYWGWKFYFRREREREKKGNGKRRQANKRHVLPSGSQLLANRQFLCHEDISEQVIRNHCALEQSVGRNEGREITSYFLSLVKVYTMGGYVPCPSRQGAAAREARSHAQYASASQEVVGGLRSFLGPGAGLHHKEGQGHLWC